MPENTDSINKEEGVYLRTLREEELPLLREMILELAEAEGLRDSAVMTVEDLRRMFLEEKWAEAYLALSGETAVGYVIFYESFSVYRAQKAMYLKNLCVRPPYRGRGYGRKTMEALRAMAGERGYFRIDWDCMRDNGASLAFYRKLGAADLSGEHVYLRWEI